MFKKFYVREVQTGAWLLNKQGSPVIYYVHSAAVDAAYRTIPAGVFEVTEQEPKWGDPYSKCEIGPRVLAG